MLAKSDGVFCKTIDDQEGGGPERPDKTKMPATEPRAENFVMKSLWNINEA
jgi:hypothetical protein